MDKEEEIPYEQLPIVRREDIPELMNAPFSRTSSSMLSLPPKGSPEAVARSEKHNELMNKLDSLTELYGIPNLLRHNNS